MPQSSEWYHRFFGGLYGRVLASIGPETSLRQARLVRAYGTRANVLLDGVRGPDDLGRDFGAGLSERELHYLAQYEFARTGEDVLWRRSKLGLRLTPAQAEAVGAAMATL